MARPASARLVDPEDDLPSTTYGGDFETTSIPRYDLSKRSAAPAGLDLMSAPEPLPYVEPTDSGRHSVLGQSDDYDELDPIPQPRPAPDRRGTQDLGLLILRLGVGAVLIGHGLQKVFGWWRGPGLEGFSTSLSEAGFRYADVLTYLAAGTQLATGALLVLGLFTPLAAAAALAYLGNALLVVVAAQHDAGYITPFLPDGGEYVITLIVALTAIILVGPGRYGFDAGRGWARRPSFGSFAALLLGIGAAAAIWYFLNGANPLA